MTVGSARMAKAFSITPQYRGGRREAGAGRSAGSKVPASVRWSQPCAGDERHEGAQHAYRDERCGHSDLRGAARVVAEVDDEGVDPAVDELGQALANEIRDVVLEVGDPDEPDAGPRDVDLDRGHRQFVSLDPEDLDHALASLDSDLDHARLVTRYPADSLDEPQTIDAGAVDGGDDVPCHQTGLGCRVVLDDEDDPELARRCDSGTSRPDCIGGVEEHSNTSDNSVGPEGTNLIRWHVVREGVEPLIDHPDDGGLHGRAHRYRGGVDARGQVVA